MVTENPALAYENGWSVRSGYDPAAVPVLRHGSDWVVFDNQGGVAPCNEQRAVRSINTMNAHTYSSHRSLLNLSISSKRVGSWNG